MHSKVIQGLCRPVERQVSQAERQHFAAPLGAVTRGRLIFAAGATGISIVGEPLLSKLYQANLQPAGSTVQVQTGIVTVQSSPMRVNPKLTGCAEPLDRLTLNATIPWEIEARGGVACLFADLRGLTLRALDLGSVSGSVLTVAMPSGVSFIYMAGSVNDVTIRRPSTAAVRIQIGGSSSNVCFDEQHICASSDGICWQSHTYSNTGARYEISIAGSVSNVTLTSW